MSAIERSTLQAEERLRAFDVSMSAIERSTLQAEEARCVFSDEEINLAI
jgi:hypothetical protein